MSKAQKPGTSAFYCSPKYRLIQCAYYFVDFESNDKLLHSINDSKQNLYNKVDQ